MQWVREAADWFFVAVAVAFTVVYAAGVAWVVWLEIRGFFRPPAPSPERKVVYDLDRLIAESDRRSRELAELKASPWVRLLGLVRGRRYELSLRLMPPLGRWVCTVTLWDKDDLENVFQGVAEDGTPEHAVAEAAAAVEEHLAELAPPADDVTEGEAD